MIFHLFMLLVLELQELGCPPIDGVEKGEVVWEEVRRREQVARRRHSVQIVVGIQASAVNI